MCLSLRARVASLDAMVTRFRGDNVAYQQVLETLQAQVAALTATRDDLLGAGSRILGERDGIKAEASRLRAALERIAKDRREMEYGCYWCGDEHTFSLDRCGDDCPGVIAEAALKEKP